MTGRLVIRIKLPRDTQPAVPERRRPGRVAVLMLAGAVALVLVVIGISVFRSEPTPAPVVTERSKPASETPQPAPATPVAEPTPVEPEVQQAPPAPPAPGNQVLPSPSRNALATIRGTIRVSVRVIVDEDGTVSAAVTETPGPSRYFERLSLEAARKWTFGPASADAQRIMLVKFSFTRGGVTARADPVAG